MTFARPCPFFSHLPDPNAKKSRMNELFTNHACEKRRNLLYLNTDHHAASAENIKGE